MKSFIQFNLSLILNSHAKIALKYLNLSIKKNQNSTLASVMVVH